MTVTTEAPSTNTEPAQKRPPRRRATTDHPIEQVSGLVDVRDKGAFIRTSGYLPGENDVRLPLSQVKELGLRPGDLVLGSTRKPYDRLAGLVSVNGRLPGQARPHFAGLTPIHPRQRLVLETESPITRLIDLLTPVGKGQRGLIVAPPKAGKTMVLKAIADAVTTNHPGVHLMIVLVGERPEEVTDFRESVHGEVIASTFDRPERDHTAIAELAVERAKRLVEHGTDVVMLLDSLTRLGRAYNVIAPNGGKTLTGGIDAQAVHLPKRLFGAARAAREGGSLTIIATALAETGSRMDDYFFEEFKGTGNMELRLSRALAEHRLFPAVDVAASSTRREELLLADGEREVIWRLRRVLSGLDREQALTVLLDRLRETPTNAAFLRQVATS
ncbi:transcription termination factor Rho [Sphaerisporangium sp. NBC_01403]|uniref:transcription termination factor Rho n=1 Tax=Sphaerisporangium sp. NBC_01403 TaxID=2903599 RepID=UPI00386C3AE6